MKKLFLNLDFIDKKKLTPEAFLVYCAIQRGKNEIKNEEYLSSNIIGYWIYGRITTRNEKRRIKNGLNELIEKEIIKEKFKINDNEIVYDISVIEENKNCTRFTYIDHSILIKIMNLKHSFNEDLLLCYVYIIHTTIKSGIKKEYEGMFSVIGVDKLSYYLNVSINTVQKYTNVLEQEKIICSARCNGIKIKNVNNKIIFSRNIYADYSNIRYIEEFIKYYNGGIIEKKRINSVNKSRSAIQKYNWLLKGKKYTDEELKEMYTYLKEWNKSRYKEWKRNGSIDTEKPLLKDLSIFKELGLEEENV